MGSGKGIEARDAKMDLPSSSQPKTVDVQRTLAKDQQERRSSIDSMGSFVDVTTEYAQEAQDANELVIVKTPPDPKCTEKNIDTRQKRIETYANNDIHGIMAEKASLLRRVIKDPTQSILNELRVEATMKDVRTAYIQEAECIRNRISLEVDQHYEHDIKSLNNNIKSLKQKIKDKGGAEKALDDRKQDLDDRKQKLDKREKKLDGKQELSNYKQELDKYEQELDKYEKELSNHNKELSNHNKELNDLKQDLDELKKKKEADFTTRYQIAIAIQKEVLGADMKRREKVDSGSQKTAKGNSWIPRLGVRLVP